MPKRHLFFLTGILIASIATAENWGKHPHLHSAHDAIDLAKTQLQQANDRLKTEFGGHRANAIRLLDQAQAEVAAAAQYADTAGAAQGAQVPSPKIQRPNFNKKW